MQRSLPRLAPESRVGLTWVSLPNDLFERGSAFLADVGLEGSLGLSCYVVLS